MSDDLELMNKWRGRLDEWPGYAWKYVNYLAKNKKLQEKTTTKSTRTTIRNMQEMPHAIFRGQCKLFYASYYHL